MKKLFIKITTGYREDQNFIIDSEEAHKAYYLFMNPDKRGVFSNGVALQGIDIKGITPAYNETMGWNPSHKIDDFDWNAIKDSGIDAKMTALLFQAKVVSGLLAKNPELGSLPLSKVDINNIKLLK